MTQLWVCLFGLRRVFQATNIRITNVFRRDWDIYVEGLLIVGGKVVGKTWIIDLDAYRIDSTFQHQYVSSLLFALARAANVQLDPSA
jgi:hypothetical protein